MFVGSNDVIFEIKEKKEHSKKNFDKIKHNRTHESCQCYCIVCLYNYVVYRLNRDNRGPIVFN